MNANLIERISFLSHFSFKDEALEKQKYINGTRDKWTVLTDALGDDKAQAQTQIRHKQLQWTAVIFVLCVQPRDEQWKSFKAQEYRIYIATYSRRKLPLQETTTFFTIIIQIWVSHKATETEILILLCLRAFL